MLSLLEKHASNLEEIVSQRTQELAEEKEHTEKLLYQMLPQYVFIYHTSFILFNLYLIIAYSVLKKIQRKD